MALYHGAGLLPLFLLTRVSLKTCGAVKLALCLALENQLCQPVPDALRRGTYRGAAAPLQLVVDPVEDAIAVACRRLVLGIGGGMGIRREVRIGTLGFLPVVINAGPRGALQVCGPQGTAELILFSTVPMQNLLARRGILDA